MSAKYNPNSLSDLRHAVTNGLLRVEVDDERRVVHVISKAARGEIRGFVIAAGRLYHRSLRPLDWPAMDSLVSETVGLPLADEVAS